MSPTLITPTSVYADSYKEALGEFMRESERPDLLRDQEQRLDDYIRRWVLNTRTLHLWLIDEGRYIGTLQIRKAPTSSDPRIPPNHIYYDVRPSQRKKGYGTAILKLGIDCAREIGLRELVITCEKGNVASRTIIERSGAILEDEITVGGKKILKYRFTL